MQLKSDKVGEKGRKYWRCSSFNGKQGRGIEGRTFKPSPKHIKPVTDKHYRYRAKHRKLPQERQMLCTDIKIDESVPEQAFIKAWNRLVDEKECYLPEWQQSIAGCDVGGMFPSTR